MAKMWTGLKVAYVKVVENFFNGPSLLSFKGRIVWSSLVVAFWTGGFIIGAAIPQIQTLSGMGMLSGAADWVNVC
jgi:hypothetical protein